MRLSETLIVLLVGCVACGPSDDAGRATDDGAATAVDTAGGPTVEAASDPPMRQRDDGTVRVVFLGTSLTAGFGLLRDSERYTDRLQELADSAGLPARMVNAGVSGETSAGGLRRLDWVIDAPLDVLVVELGANDGLRGQDPAALERNLREIVNRTRQRHPDAAIVLAGMEAPTNMGERYASRFRGVFGKVAEESGAMLVPFLLDDVAGVPELNQGDGMHPTAEGHRIMARNVWAVLEPLLRDRLADADESDGEPGA